MRLIDANALLQNAGWFNLCIDKSIHAVLSKDIHNAQTILQNDYPLTIDELLEMDGQPVWNETIGKWFLIDLQDDTFPKAVNAQGKYRPLDDKYYLRKPDNL